MLHAKTPPHEKRAAFRAALASGRLLRLPGAFNPLSAKLIEEKGFEGVYVSGAVLSADLGLPDIGLTTLTEVATRAGQIARMTDLPSIVDPDTGFGEPMNVARTVQELEYLGPFGPGNPEPVFALKAAVKNQRVLKGRHLKLNLSPVGADPASIEAMVPASSKTMICCRSDAG
jgi:hypothetical protein